MDQKDQDIVKGYCDDYMKLHLQNYTNEDDSFKKGCANAYRYVTDFSLHPKISAFCGYTNYWFYGELKSHEKNENYEALLHDFFERLSNFEVCVQYTEAIDEHDLYDKFYNFKNKSSTQHGNPCEEGRLCAQEYKNHQISCKGNGNNRFCNELEKFRDLFNDHLKSENGCKDIKELPSFQGSPLAATISIPFSVMSVISFFSFVTYKVGNFFVKKR
ncbi:hypothetical protein PCYB_005340 [Plasmodium cynomolgi strain B]|uniref:PIR Superfamily Protein n=1 Tax=Plasmodium cynomolgi (strain B) TaxID=1120755 RepID=K6V364_PLACD|nr:hypothetical protein PCYB_005340 [Plasmodium cynomolgi strain B]GAB69785.1 hypothetical protein PCYB_005340 [Plasmodium cynomolgi strain B]